MKEKKPKRGLFVYIRNFFEPRRVNPKDNTSGSDDGDPPLTPQAESPRSPNRPANSPTLLPVDLSSPSITPANHAGKQFADAAPLQSQLASEPAHTPSPKPAPKLASKPPLNPQPKSNAAPPSALAAPPAATTPSPDAISATSGGGDDGTAGVSTSPPPLSPDSAPDLARRLVEAEGLLRPPLGGVHGLPLAEAADRLGSAEQFLRERLPAAAARLCVLEGTLFQVREEEESV